jgi:hypothetical protein
MTTKTFEDYLKECGEEITELVQKKNLAYGDAVNTCWSLLSALYPKGIAPDQLKDALLVIRILDKLCRIAKGDAKAFGESPFSDIAGYGIIGMSQKKMIYESPTIICHPGPSPKDCVEGVTETDADAPHWYTTSTESVE